MNEWYKRASEKLAEEKKTAKYDRYADAMKDTVCEALDRFCKQDEEFAQAVVQGGTFEDCMKAVAKNCGSAIPDLEVCRRAAQFYFPGAGVKFYMEIDLCASVKTDEEPDQTPKAECKILSLEDFL